MGSKVTNTPTSLCHLLPSSQEKPIAFAKFRRYAIPTSPLLGKPQQKTTHIGLLSVVIDGSVAMIDLFSLDYFKTITVK